MITTRKEYEMAYRALRRWNKAGHNGYSPRQLTEHYRYIRDAYNPFVFNKALVTLFNSNAYLMYQNKEIS